MLAIADRTTATTPSTSSWTLGVGLMLAMGCAPIEDSVPTTPDWGPAPSGPIAQRQTGALRLEVEAIEGATGPAGRFAAGDTVVIDFRLAKADGTPIDRLDRFEAGGALISGPTRAYQRVIGAQDDLLGATALGGGRYRYRFATPLPQTYLEPFGATDTVALAALATGTYTVGIELRGALAVDSIGETGSFLLAGPGFETGVVVASKLGLEGRDLVAVESCDGCHGRFGAHDGHRRDLNLCGLCHTRGAQDWAESGPESLDFRVLIHRVHAGADLPSAQGVLTGPDGRRLYDGARTPLHFTASDGAIHTPSGARFPIAPNRAVGLPADDGFAQLSPAARAAEDAIRRGASTCGACHGDPDSDGPLSVPAQAGLIYAQPSRAACGSCHDDVNWATEYVANGQTMPAQDTDGACLGCHAPTDADLAALTDDDALAVSTEAAHQHPARADGLRSDVRFELLDVTELGQRAGDGQLDVGEKIGLVLRLTGADPAEMAQVEVVISGPARSPQVVYRGLLPASALDGNQPYLTPLPVAVALEVLGSSDGPGQILRSRKGNHWVDTAPTIVHAATVEAEALGALAQPARRGARWLAVEAEAALEIGEILALDGEFVEVAWVAGEVVGLVSDLVDEHALGASLFGVLLERVPASGFELNPITGRFVLEAQWPGATLLTSYTTDFEVPGTFPAPLNDGPTLGQPQGEWTGLAMVDGIYTAGVGGYRTLELTAGDAVTEYALAVPTATLDFAIGAPAAAAPTRFIESGAACVSCHAEVLGHEGTRSGFAGCVQCHRSAGIERLEDEAGPAAFRVLIHEAHGGVAAEGFPFQPGGVRSCEACHGERVEWQSPAERTHPAGGGSPARIWAPVCGSCHDTEAAAAHLLEALPVPQAPEPCAACHGPRATLAPVAAFHGLAARSRRSGEPDAGVDAETADADLPQDAGPVDAERAQDAEVDADIVDAEADAGLDAGADSGADAQFMDAGADAGADAQFVDAQAPDGAPPRCDGDGVAPTWEADVQPLIVASCGFCHGPNPTLGALSSLDTYAAITGGSPEDPDRPLYELVADRVQGIGPIMPPFGVLPAEQIAVFVEWSQAGAPLCAE